MTAVALMGRAHAAPAVVSRPARQEDSTGGDVSATCVGALHHPHGVPTSSPSTTPTAATLDHARPVLFIMVNESAVLAPRAQVNESVTVPTTPPAKPRTPASTRTRLRLLEGVAARMPKSFAAVAGALADNDIRSTEAL